MSDLGDRLKQALLPFEDIIQKNASEFSIEPMVIKTTIITESLGIPWSYRYEPTWPDKYLIQPMVYAENLGISAPSETILQKTSLGLMHPMGSVCRENGWKDMLSQIFEPRLSIYFGCIVLKKKMQAYGNDPCTIYAAYNAGSVIKTTGGLFINEANVDRFHQNYLLLSEE